MKKRLILFLLLAVAAFCRAQAPAAYGPEHDGFRLAKDPANRVCLINKNGAIVTYLDTANVNADSVMAGIAASPLPDKGLILRVLSQYRDPAMKLNELMNMTQQYDEIAVLVLRDAERWLRRTRSPEQLEELKQRKK